VKLLSFSLSDTDGNEIFKSSIELFLSSVYVLQLDHYPLFTYTLPEASDTHFNLVKSIFLGKVFGKHAK